MTSRPKQGTPSWMVSRGYKRRNPDLYDGLVVPVSEEDASVITTVLVDTGYDLDAIDSDASDEMYEEAIATGKGFDASMVQAGEEGDQDEWEDEGQMQAEDGANGVGYSGYAAEAYEAGE